MSTRAERMDTDILFFKEEVDEVINEELVKKWLHQVCNHENKEIENLNYIFCTDSYLLDINKEYLKHFNYTDVITFQYHEPGESISGDIFISTDRVKENAISYNVTFEDELRRVIVHGLLHLIGYKDSDEDQKKEMRNKEDFYLKRF
ncbi:MAG: rRNA maturation RNase YbeY [Bacteroidales bacterium]|nr:rRNA maturation RNase YbeY [Bacteroidales bacterium]